MKQAALHNTMDPVHKTPNAENKSLKKDYFFLIAMQRFEICEILKYGGIQFFPNTSFILICMKQTMLFVALKFVVEKM